MPSSPWDGFANTVLNQFDSGFDMGRSTRRDREAKALAAQAADRHSAERAEDVGFKERHEMGEDADRAYRREKDMGFETPDVFRERMKKKAESENALRAAQAHRLMNPVAKTESDATAAKLAEQSIEDVDAEEMQLAKDRPMWGTRWFRGDPQLPKESVARRKEARESVDDYVRRRLGSKAGGTDKKAIYLKARSEGKSEAEARALAGG